MKRSFPLCFIIVSVVFQIIPNSAHEELSHQEVTIDEDRECTLFDLYDFSETKNLSKVNHDSHSMILTYEYSIVPYTYNYVNETYQKTAVHNLEETDDVVNAIRVKLEYQGEAWLGTGLSGASRFVRMLGGQVVIAKPELDEGPSNPGKYLLMSKTVDSVTLMQPDQQTLIDASFTQTPSSSILEYTKILEESGEHSININEENQMIFAIGSSNEFNRHLYFGGFTINPGASCAKWLKNKPVEESESNEELEHNYSSSSSQFNANSNKGLWIAHGIFAVLAWAITAPLSVMVAIFRHYFTTKDTGELGRRWFMIHFCLNITCLICTFISLFLAITALSESQSKHFNEPHKIVGLLMFLFLCLQIVFALTRSDKVISLDDGRKCTKRVVWEYLHRILGISLIGSAIWQIQSGLYHYGERFGVSTVVSTYVYYSWVSLLSVIAIVIRVKNRCYVTKH